MAKPEDIKGILTSVNKSMSSQIESFNTQMSLMTSTNDKLVQNSEEQTAVLRDILLLFQEQKDKQKKFIPTTDTDVVVEGKKEPAGETLKGKGDEAKKAAEETGLSLLDLFGGLLAGGAALGLAFAGLRGWEVKIIGYVKDSLGSITGSIMNGLKSIKTSIFLSFGLDDAGKVLPNSALDDILKKPVIKTLVTGLSKILAPIQSMGDYMTGLLSGGGGAADDTGKAVSFLSKIGSNIGAFAKTVGKILKPLGFLFSAYDGVMAFMNTEGSYMDKFVAGIGGFLGDFIGAPLDLLKDIVSWALSKLGFENAAELLDGFSVETLISDLIGSIWNMVKGAGEWIKTLFTDPKEALSQYWTALYGEGGVVDMLFTPISMAIDWITKKFGWRDEDAPPFDLYDTVSGFVTSVLSWAKEKLTTLSTTLSEGFDKFVDYIVSIPDRINFAAEGMFIDVGEKLAKGFISFGDWLASIPSRIKAMALGVLNSISVTNPITGYVYKLVTDEELAAAQAAVMERASDTNEKLNTIEENANKMRESLQQRMDESGIYNSATAATAESPISSDESERLRMQREEMAVRAFQDRVGLVSGAANQAASAPVIMSDNSTKVDGRSTVSVVNQQIVNSPVSYGGLGDSRMNYPSGTM
jgi:hypothetical protein